jgi:hypothetical protein
MIVSPLYRETRALLSAPAALLRRDIAKDAELLVPRHKNAVLRRQLNGPVRYELADRFWLAVLSSLLPRHRWRNVFPVTRGRAQEVDAAPGARKPTVGPPHNPGRAGPAGASDRTVHSLEDPARGRHRLADRGTARAIYL